MRVGFQIVGHLETLFDIVSLELVNREDVGTAKIHWSTFLRSFSFSCEPYFAFYTICRQGTTASDRQDNYQANAGAAAAIIVQL